MSCVDAEKFTCVNMLHLYEKLQSTVISYIFSFLGILSQIKMLRKESQLDKTTCCI